MSGFGDERPLIINDPGVQRVTDVDATLQALTGSRMGLPTWRTAVVGRDDVGDLGVDLNDGDLWLAAEMITCDPAPLVVHETATSVTVAMTAISIESSVIPGDYGTCHFPLSSFRVPSLESLVIVRVPLEQPLGSREVITVRPPERENDGVLIPGISPNPATPTPTP